MPSRREKALIEAPVVQRALRELLVASIPLKLVGGSDTGWPDQMFLIPGGKPLFIELKWPGLALEAKQCYKHKILTDLGYSVETHDNVEEALDAIRKAVAESNRKKRK